MENKITKLKSLLADAYDLSNVAALLSWDEQTKMPPGGAEARSYQMAAVSRLAHEKFTSDEIGRLLEDLQVYENQLDPDTDEARLLHITRRDYNKRIRVPSTLVSEFARVTAAAHTTWVVARQQSDFGKLRPDLERIVALRREYASLFAPYDHIYDPLFDDYEPGMKTAEVRQIFDRIRPQQVALVHAIAERPQVEDAFLHKPFDEQKQENITVDVITRFGFDWKRGRQDRSAHPFTTSFSPGDVRLTTRFLPDSGISALFSSMHECGHALYEQGINPAYARTPLGQPPSMALHESQSRLWENLVGAPYDFWVYYYPRFQETFSTQLGNVDLEAFYKAVNKSEPSPIRVEADEATYNLHIMLRLELEIALMEGKLEVRDLPEAWNERMREYLGITPANDAQGVLQDVHWSGGSIGYFATYALGNIISVQIWERILSEIPDLPAQIRRGEFASLRAWLEERIHRFGGKYEPQELVQRVTGSRIDPEPYLRYLRTKFGEIYAL
ncbi:MAG: carboxypeptidase M32 [Chloroflexi bacterium]|nr:carboxypeptidase M32 [Chloroflexota bacterium]